jgi:signal transduction histidine kinase
MVPAELGGVLESVFCEAGAKGHALSRETERRSGGVVLPLELSATAVRGMENPSLCGDGPALLLVARNRAAGQRLARLEEIDRLKTEFISTASHELRSPLHTVQEAVKLLSGSADGLSEEQHRLVEIAERNVDWLVRLVGDLLDMSRLESGRIDLEPCPLDLDALCASVAERFRIEAERKDLELRLALESGATRVALDPDRIEQVLVNLMSNALKFTLEGFVELRTSSGEEEVRIEVADSGVGIAPEDLPLVFDHFEQVGAHRQGRRRGTGLGLAISRRLVELHGGTLSARSLPGEGSTFTVSLPRAKAAGS